MEENPGRGMGMVSVSRSTTPAPASSLSKHIPSPRPLRPKPWSLSEVFGVYQRRALGSKKPPSIKC